MLRAGVTWVSWEASYIFASLKTFVYYTEIPCILMCRHWKEHVNILDRVSIISVNHVTKKSSKNIITMLMYNKAFHKNSIFILRQNLNKTGS